MDENLKEALQMVETLAARLQLAHHERGYLTTEAVDKTVKEAGELLYKHGYRSDMAAHSDDE